MSQSKSIDSKFMKSLRFISGKLRLTTTFIKKLFGMIEKTDENGETKEDYPTLWRSSWVFFLGIFIGTLFLGNEFSITIWFIVLCIGIAFSHMDEAFEVLVLEKN